MRRLHALDRRDEGIEPVGAVRVRDREHDAVLPRRPVLLSAKAKPATGVRLLKVFKSSGDLRAYSFLVRFVIYSERISEELDDLGRHFIHRCGLVCDGRLLQLVELEVRVWELDDGVSEGGPAEAGGLVVLEDDITAGHLSDLHGGGAECFGGKLRSQMVERCARSQFRGELLV